jgi:hypothetical protein
MKDPDRVEVTVPPDDFRIGHVESDVYNAAQFFIKQAIHLLGPEMGVSVVVSGIGRELRRHMSVEEVQQTLRKFADTMPEAARGDQNA